MALISRPYEYVSGNVIDPAEVTAVEDALYDAINGGLDETNFSDTTQIPSDYLAQIDADKVDDSSNNTTAFRTTRSAGTSGSPTLPTTQKHEIQTLRYRLLTQGRHRVSTAGTAGGGGSFINDSNTLDTIAWYEAPVVNTGRNLLPNNGFEVKTTGSTAAPDGWSLVGTPSSLTIITTAQDTVGSSKRALRIQNDAADEGISCTVKGLKASTKYLIGLNYVRTAGTIKIHTTGGLGAGNDYQNYSSTDSSTSGSLATNQFVVQTDSTGTDIVFNITISSGAGGDIAVYATWMYELNDTNQGELPLLPAQKATSSTLTDYASTGSAWVWTNHSALALSQYIPFWGYRLVYEVTISYTSEPFNISATDVETSPDNDYAVFGFRLKLDSGSGASVVEGPFVDATRVNSSNFAKGGVVTLRYIEDNPTPGATYSFTVEAGAYGKSAAWASLRVNPLIDDAQSVSTSRLYLERM